jgi:Mn-dependent DtxR family transcriptional regulator
MKHYTERVRRATIAVVDRLRRDGESINRTTVSRAMGVSGPCAAHRLKVLADMGVIRVDPMPDRYRRLTVAAKSALLNACIESRRAEGVEI